jgi:glutathione S-transferase
MKLYDLSLSPNSRKVRAVAAELGVEITVVPVDLQKGDNRTPEFLAKNPNAKCPVLEDDGFVLWESNAILCYLAALRPAKGLLPADPRGRADVDRWLFWQTAHLGPAVAKVVYEKVYKPMRGGGDPDPAVIEAGLVEFKRFAAVLDTCLAGREFVAGRLSVADFALAATLSSREAAGLDIAPYPNLRAWLERVESRESWKRSAPPKK